MHNITRMTFVLTCCKSQLSRCWNGPLLLSCFVWFVYQRSCTLQHVMEGIFLKLSLTEIRTYSLFPVDISQLSASIKPIFATEKRRKDVGPNTVNQTNGLSTVRTGDGTGQMWRDLREGTPLCTWHSSPLRSLECDFPSALPSVEPARASTTTVTCIVGVSLGFGEGHVRPVGWDKCSHTWCQTWERTVSRAKHAPICKAWWAQRDLSAQGPLEPAALRALCRKWRLAFSQSRQEFPFLPFYVADILIQNYLCRLSAWESRSRTLEQEKYSKAEASVTFWMQDNLSTQKATLPGS